MKYIVIIGDGMADLPIKELNNKTILQYTKKPIMDYFAKNGRTGLALTVPNNYIPGSDVANMSIFGYDPNKYYTGRAPLEAISMNLKLDINDIAFRCNFITINDAINFEDSILLDYSADHITSNESKELLNDLFISLQKEYNNNLSISIYPGISYRNIALTKNNFGLNLKCTPPHDIINKKIKDYLPSGENSKIFIEIMKKSYKILSKHPININRIKIGKLPANCIWLWGQGTAPKLDSFYSLYHKRGSVISAIDLLKGLGICSGMNIINVENATGFLDTNYSGKVSSALDSLKTNDIVFIHIEAPDECGHMGDYRKKIISIEHIDNFILKPIYDFIKKNTNEQFKILILPDHATPISLKTHTSEPVPFLIYDSKENLKDCVSSFDEYSVLNGYFSVVNAWELMNILFEEEKINS